jgi:hypothetical protein
MDKKMSAVVLLVLQWLTETMTLMKGVYLVENDSGCGDGVDKLIQERESR